MKKNIGFSTFALLLFVFFATQNAIAQIEIELEQVASGLSSPIDITHAGDERLFIIERSGRIRMLDADGSLMSGNFLDIDSQVANTGGQSEQGLLGLAFHPDYANNGYFFVHYSRNNGDGVVSRYSVDPNNPNQADPNSEEKIMEFSQPYGNHNGGGLKFGPDGYLYIGLGDGGLFDDPQNRSQNRQDLLGKMLRIDIDNGLPYTIPADNPFAMDDETLDEIWSIGLRNPWRYSFDKETGDLWMGDVGQGDWEEINFQSASSTGGENYGWRCYEGNHAYITGGCADASTFTEAAVEYNHQGFTHCSVTGGFVYRGSESPALTGHYLYADYCSGRFWSAFPDGSGGFTSQEIGSFPGYDISTFGEDINGELYVARMGQGRIYKIKAACPASTDLEVTDLNGVLNATMGFTSYQWFLNGAAIDGAMEATYTATEIGNYTVEVMDVAGCGFTSEVIEVVTNTDNLPSVSQLTLSPNPFVDKLLIQLETSRALDMTIIIYDVQGQQVFEKTIATNGTQTETLSLASLQSGVYVVHFRTAEGEMTRKVVRK